MVKTDITIKAVRDVLLSLALAISFLLVVEISFLWHLQAFNGVQQNY